MRLHDNPGLLKKKARERLRTDQKNIERRDLDTVVAKADTIERRFKTHGPLGRFITDARLLISMVRDYVKGDYREVPWWAITAITAALLYVLSPIDLIPDFIPVIGFLDDGMVMAACLMMVEQDLHSYRAWKLAQANLPEDPDEPENPIIMPSGHNG